MNAKQAKRIRQELRAQGTDVTQGLGRTNYRKAKRDAVQAKALAAPQTKDVRRTVGVPSAGKASNFKGFRNSDHPWRSDTAVMVADYSLSEEKKSQRASNLAQKRHRARGRLSLGM